MRSLTFCTKSESQLFLSGFVFIDHGWLRWCDGADNWLLADTALAAQRSGEAVEKADSESQRADETEALLRQVVRNLRQSGMDGGAIARIVGLPKEQIGHYDEG